MKYSKAKVQALTKTHGGKLRYSRQYLSKMNDDGMTVFCEPYAAGAGILLNSEFPGRRILNDLNPSVTTILTESRDRGEEVAKILQRIPYSEESFARAGRELVTLNQRPTDYAAWYIARNRMSSGGRFDRFAKTDTSVRLRGGQMGDKNAWENFINKHIYNTIEKLQGVEVYNECALKLIRRLSKLKSGPNTLYLLDPPYLSETVVTKNQYEYNVTEGHHRELLALITSVPGRFYLCGYWSQLYEDELERRHGWRSVVFDRPSDAGRTKSKGRRTEVLWTNAHLT